MSEIEVGDYVRTKEGFLGKVIDMDTENFEEPAYFLNNKQLEREQLGFPITICRISKHSKNIIDLIEVGDYVNGCEVLDIHIPRDIWDPVETRINSRYTNFLLADEIKSIVTKEQMASIEYRVEV